jgi:uncharacterized damage-inducible protein DinB
MAAAKTLLLADIEYSGWANQRLLEACSALAAEEVERDLNVSHVSILATLRHICDGEKVWLDCLSTTAAGESWRLPMGAVPEPSLDELKQIWPPLWGGYRRWLSGLPDESAREAGVGGNESCGAGLGIELIVQLPDGTAPRLARWKILRHVLDHSIFHRGQLVGMIRSLGHTPPAINRMDYWLVNPSA